MKCITIKQPWVWGIFHGKPLKSVENRSWNCHHRGQLLIHAGRRPTGVNSAAMREYNRDVQFMRDNGQDVPEIDSMVFSAIVGVVDMVGCENWEAARDKLVAAGRAGECFWVAREMCWMFGDRRVFGEPVLQAGKQGLYDVARSSVADR